VSPSTRHTSDGLFIREASQRTATQEQVISNNKLNMKLMAECTKGTEALQTAELEGLHDFTWLLKWQWAVAKAAVESPISAPVCLAKP
jgi:hypothetical protein